MDPSSIAGLVFDVVNLVRGTKRLIQNVKLAPTFIGQLEGELLSFQSRLNFICTATKELGLDGSVDHPVNEELEQCKTLLRRLENRLLPLVRHSTTTKTQALLKRAKTGFQQDDIEKEFSELATIRMCLMMALQLLGHERSK